jgi:threonine/homoserine/homoserine lactone efflux protein
MQAIEILKFLLIGFTVGLTGALMPGPMLFATIELSLKKGWTSGPEVFLGHMLVELMLCVLIFHGAASVFDSDLISTIFLIGGLSLVFFGLLTVKDARSAASSSMISQNPSGMKLKSSPVLLGLITSVSNPYFWIWWLTAGSAFLLKGYEMGIITAAAFIIGHWAADLSWFTAVSGSISRGKVLFSQKIHTYILYACGIFLITFGFSFIFSYNSSVRFI